MSRCGYCQNDSLRNSTVLNNYGPILYGALGFDADQQLAYQIGWLTLAFGSGCFALIFVEWFPRPKLIAFGIMFCVVCLAIEAALVATYATPERLADPNPAALRAAVAVSHALTNPEFAARDNLTQHDRCSMSMSRCGR